MLSVWFIAFLATCLFPLNCLPIRLFVVVVDECSLLAFGSQNSCPRSTVLFREDLPCMPRAVILRTSSWKTLYVPEQICRHRAVLRTARVAGFRRTAFSPSRKSQKMMQCKFENTHADILGACFGAAGCVCLYPSGRDWCQLILSPSEFRRSTDRQSTNKTVVLVKRRSCVD